ncbi:MAG TPA: hypothetical protein VMN79_00815 [Casimicrobiaceae bacterium]|nr:hypothetical protein [Casimicrobiaceae bacterium]
MDSMMEQPLDIRGAVRTDARIQSATEAAHETTDRVARAATQRVDRLRGSAHDAVEGTADLVESACATIRSRPIAAVAGMLVAGFLLGRLTR